MKEQKNIKLSKSQRSAIELARKTAQQSRCPFKHGAVLIKSSALINTAYNSKDYSRFANRLSETTWFQTRHAEAAACLNVPHALTKGSTLFIVRVNNSGKFALSKPCNSCMNVLYFCEVKRVVYSDVDGTFSSIKL